MRAWETACNWLKTNRNFWHQWVPRETDCARGQGLVDALGAFVTNVSQALKCATCPSGYAALQHNGQRICSPCPAGFFQNFPGESSCLPCEPGSIAMEEGSRECQPCRLGEFANGSAMTSCYRCGQGDHRETWQGLLKIFWYFSFLHLLKIVSSWSIHQNPPETGSAGISTTFLVGLWSSQPRIGGPPVSWWSRRVTWRSGFRCREPLLRTSVPARLEAFCSKAPVSWSSVLAVKVVLIVLISRHLFPSPRNGMRKWYISITCI